MTLKKKHDVDIMSAQKDHAIDHTQPFTAQQDGFFVAAALTAYDDNTEIIEDKRYGEIYFEHYGWGNDGDSGSKAVKLEQHYCSDEELGLTESPDSLIFPIQEQALSTVTFYKKKFKCIDEDDLVIWGDYNSLAA